MHEVIKIRINSMTVCYYLAQNLLSYHLPSKNIKTEIYGTIILPVVLYGCKTWSLSVKDQYRLKVFKNRCWERHLGLWRKKYQDRGKYHTMWSFI